MALSKTVVFVVLIVVFVIAQDSSNEALSSTTTSTPSICHKKCNCTKARERLHLDCSNKNLSEIPKNLSKKLFTFINMSCNHIHVVRNDSFSNMKNLLSLDLSNNNLEKIETGAFKGLKELRNLNISHNDNLPITDETFNETLFEDLTSLEELKMYGTTTANLPHDYPNEALGHLVNLKVLWMDGMTKKDLGEQLRNLSNLTHLMFPGDQVGFGLCDMLYVNRTFSTVTSLTHLYIRKCGLLGIDKYAFRNLSHLKYLDLSLNYFSKFTYISQSFWGLQFTSIKVLVLNSVRQARFDDCGTIITHEHTQYLGNTSLKELYLENNGITKADGERPVKDLEGLEVISLRKNSLRFDAYLLYANRLEHIRELTVSYQFFNDLWYSPYPPSFSHQAPKKIGYDGKNTYNSPYSVRNHDIVSEHDVCDPLPVPFPPLVPFLPSKLEYLDCSHSHMNLPLYNVTVDDNYSIKRINASNAMFFCWEGPIYGLHALQYLDLSSNLCSRVGSNFFDEFKNLTELNIANNILNRDVKTDERGSIMKNLVKLEYLDMSLNRLQYIPLNFLLAQKHLKRMNFSSNLLTSFDIDIEHMDQLLTIDLSDNGISTISVTQRMKLETVASISPLTINLTGNGIHCYCKTIDFIKWVKQTEKTSLTIILDRCFDENENIKNISNTQKLDSLITELKNECASHIDIIVLATAGAVLMTNIVVGILVYRYRWKLRYWYYVSRHHYRRRRKYGLLRGFDPVNDDHMKFDVFVICSDEDAGGEFVNDMYCYLQNKCNLKLIESERDFLGNGSMFDMIGSAIHQSRVSVFVLTRKWLEESRGWWRFAIYMCKEEALNRGNRVHFNIFIDDLSGETLCNKSWKDVSEMLSKKDSLEYPETTDDRLAFWKECVQRVKEMSRPSAN